MARSHPKSNRAIAFLKKIEVEHSLTQLEIAKIIGLTTQASVSALFKGKSNMSPDSVNALISAYPEAEEFINGSNSQTEQARADSFNDRIQGIEVTNQRPLRVVHERAHAGFASGWSDKEWIDNLPVEMFSVQNDGNYVAFEVVGDSMDGGKNPIYAGDVLAAREVYFHH